MIELLSLPPSPSSPLQPTGFLVVYLITFAETQLREKRQKVASFSSPLCRRMESKGEEEQPLQQDERRKNANKPPYKLAYQYKNRRERSNSNGKSRLDEITCTMSLRSEDFRQPWFHRTATRSVANKLLIDKQVGTFLIRPSSQR